MSDILRVEKLTKTYPQRGKPEIIAVDNISFSVREGELVGLLGPNGAGKNKISYTKNMSSDAPIFFL
jgi:ABC-type multidrug transport system ATPase subunit